MEKHTLVSKNIINEVAHLFEDINKVENEILPFIKKVEPEFYNFIVKYSEDLKNTNNLDSKLTAMAQKIFIYSAAMVFIIFLKAFYNFIGEKLEIK